MNLSRQFTRREKILLLILAALLLFAVYFYAVSRPTSAVMESTQSQIENLKTEIAILDAKKQRMDAMQSELDTLHSSASAMPIPAYDNLQQLMVFLNNVLDGTNDYTLSFPSLDLPVEDSGSDIVRRHLQMTFVSPNYAAARQTLNQLQACPFCSQLKDVSIIPVTESRNALGQNASLLGNPVQVTLTMSFYENMN